MGGRASDRSTIFPWRYGLFLSTLASAAPLTLLGLRWHIALLAAFDAAALLFVASLFFLLRHDASVMRRHARENDANRGLMLLITVIVTLAVLIATGVELDGPSGAGQIILVVATLAITWLFANGVYALHYAHLYYLPGRGGTDGGGLDFPGTKTPDYPDFFYFAFTLGMTFQTSDVGIRSAAIRRVVIGHTLAAFTFNLGILAFTINVLGGLSH